MKIKIIFFLAAFIGGLSCTRMAPELLSEEEGLSDCTPKHPDQHITYDNYVKGILAANCTESCHRGGNTPGPGDFTSYRGLLPFTGKIFYYRVIQDHADMPQDKAPLPASVRDSLNTWMENCSPQF